MKTIMNRDEWNEMTEEEKIQLFEELDAPEDDFTKGALQQFVSKESK